MDTLQDMIGHLVEVEFRDHARDLGAIETLSCRVWGKLISCTKRQIVVQQWETEESLTEETENVVLVRSAVGRVKKLVVVE